MRVIDGSRTGAERGIDSENAHAGRLYGRPPIWTSALPVSQSQSDVSDFNQVLLGELGNTRVQWGEGAERSEGGRGVRLVKTTPHPAQRCRASPRSPSSGEGKQ